MLSLGEVREALARRPGALVAFSGGVDSSVLAVLAHEALGQHSLAVTALSPSFPARDRRAVQAIVSLYGLQHNYVESAEFSAEAFRQNDRERCYHCKRIRFTALWEMARREGLAEVWEGSHLDDLTDFRPGLRALRELGAKSPWQELGLGKGELRELARQLGLPNAEAPSGACLATRIPYGTVLSTERLRRIEAAEDFLYDRGFGTVRVRDHGGLARLEVGPDEGPRLLAKAGEVARALRDLGFTYVSLDLEGYRSGSLNQSGEESA